MGAERKVAAARAPVVLHHLRRRFLLGRTTSLWQMPQNSMRISTSSFPGSRRAKRNGLRKPLLSCAASPQQAFLPSAACSSGLPELKTDMSSEAGCRRCAEEGRAGGCCGKQRASGGALCRLYQGTRFFYRRQMMAAAGRPSSSCWRRARGVDPDNGGTRGSSWPPC